MSEPQTQQRAIDVGREVYSLVKEMLGCYFPDMPSSEILRVGVAAQDAVQKALSNEADHVLPKVRKALEAAGDALCQTTWELRRRTPKSVNSAVDAVRDALALLEKAQP